MDVNVKCVGELDANQWRLLTNFSGGAKVVMMAKMPGSVGKIIINKSQIASFYSVTFHCLICFPVQPLDGNTRHKIYILYRIFV